MNSFKSFLLWLFTPAILISIICILITLYVDEVYKTDLPRWLKIVLDFAKAISIAVLVAGIFSWITSTERFIKRTQSILENILIDMKFLAYLDDRKKKEIIKSLFRSDESVNIVPDIDGYYNFYIDHILQVAHETVRTNYFVDTNIWYDSQINKVVCEKHHRYRTYRNEKGFYDDITIGVIPSDIFFELSDVRISNDKQVLDIIEKPEAVEKDWEGEKAKIATINLSQFQEEEVLIVELVICEHGFDHWYTPAIQVLQPTHGLTYKISCKKGMLIKTIDVFSQGALFETRNNGTEATITSNQWLNPGVGVSVIVARDEQVNSEELTAVCQQSHQKSRIEKWLTPITACRKKHT